MQNIIHPDITHPNITQSDISIINLDNKLTSNSIIRFYIPINTLFYIVMMFIIMIIIIMKLGKLSFSEMWTNSIERILYKKELLNKNGFKTNMTYLYYASSNEIKQQNIIKSNIEAFLNTLEYLDESNHEMYSGNKLSLKLNQFGKSYEEIFSNLEIILNHAAEKNIFVWIAAHKRKHLKDEIKSYLKCLEKGYKNVGITLCCYHKSINKSVDDILGKKGNIRLVKGYYKDGEIKDDIEITKNYYNNACKLINDGRFHQLATHDFKNIIFPLYLEYKNTKYDFENNDNIEFGFFYNALKHVKYQLKNYNIKLKNKCCLVTYGNKVKYLRTNIYDISLFKMIKLKAII